MGAWIVFASGFIASMICSLEMHNVLSFFNAVRSDAVLIRACSQPKNGILGCAISSSAVDSGSFSSVVRAMSLMRSNAPLP